MLTAHQISKSYQNNPILKDVSFSINKGERVGLIGPNGCGKTTLFRILIGKEKPDSGHASTTPLNLRIGYLPQAFNPDPKITIEELIQEVTDDPVILDEKLSALGSKLAENPDQRDLQAAYDDILNRIQRSSSIGRLSSILRTLELDKLPHDQVASTMSGGQKARLSLALVLLSDPQLLLLDEPTNNLDITILEWFENWLNNFRGAALIVTHDRTFLERSVTRILDLNPDTLTIRSHDGTYSEYIETIKRDHEKQWGAYRDQTVDIRRMKQDIIRTKAQAERTEREASSVRIGGEKMKQAGYKDYQQGIAKKVARKAKSRQKKLDRYLDSDDRVEKPKAGWQIKLEFINTTHLGRDVLAIENLAVGYPGCNPLLVDLDLNVQSGQRIAFTGPNGSGKTTLLRIIAGHQKPMKGTARLGSSVKLGYMAQEQEILDPEMNAVETLQSVAIFNQTEVRSFLHYYLFSGDAPLRPIKYLSFGERSRLLLARLVAQGCNFLLLDEPINHLDIPSRERFENALSNFKGTVLAVVHDRYFIQTFASDLWLLENRGIRREVLS